MTSLPTTSGPSGRTGFRRILGLIGLGLAMAALLVVHTARAHPEPAAAVKLVEATERVELTGRMELLRDDSGTMTFAEVSGPQARFQPLPGTLVAGYSQAAFWLRFPLKVLSGSADDWLLEVEMPYLDRVDLYFQIEGDDNVQIQHAGDRRPFSERPIAYRNFLFPLTLGQGQSAMVYLRLQTTSTVIAKARLWQPTPFAAAAAREAALLGLLHGAAVVIVLSALVQFLVTRQRVYGLYACYVLSMELTYLSVNGYGAQFLFPSQPELADAVTSLGACWSTMFGLLIASPLLAVDRRHPWVHRSYQILAVIALMFSGTVLIDRYFLIAGPLHLIVLYVCVAQLVISLRAAFRGDRPALTYFLAFGTQLLSMILIVARNLGLPPLIEAVDLGAQIGTVCHMTLLSYGLAQRLVAAEAEQRRAQAALLEAAQQAERELERRVAERTADLAAEVAERRRAEQRLRESEHHLRSLLETAPFPMLVTRLGDGAVLYLNQPCTRLLGNPVGPTTESRETGAIPDFYQTLIAEEPLQQDLLRDGAALGRELCGRRADGTPCWLLLSAVRFRYEGEEAVMTCLNDISARKEAELTLQEAKERTEAALREQRDFLAMVSHEFRSPLAVIAASASSIARFPEDVEDTGEEAKRIGEAVLRLQRMIDSLLTDDWLAATSAGLQVRPIDLCALLTELRRERTETAPEADLALECDDQPSVLGNRSLLRVVFTNLIDNALKYSPPGSSVSLQVRRVGAGAEISIRDQGIGIAADEIERIFDRFFRSPSAARIRGGAGLGLYLVRRIVALHGGTVEVDSQPGAGSRFTVRLPGAAPPPLEPGRPSPSL